MYCFCCFFYESAVYAEQYLAGLWGMLELHIRKGDCKGTNFFPFTVNIILKKVIQTFLKSGNNFFWWKISSFSEKILIFRKNVIIL